MPPIRAQVSGYLIARDYEEGQLVEDGRPALPHRPAPVPGRARSGAGTSSAARAPTLERARLDVVRYTPLVKQGAVSRQEYDNAVAERARRAGVGAGGAAPRSRRRRSISASRRSARPIDGIVGVAQAQLGDFVGPSRRRAADGGLAARPDPRVLPGQRAGIPALRAARRRRRSDVGHFREGALELILADGSVYPHRGTGYPAGREVDPRTGTITVKGDVPESAITCCGPASTRACASRPTCARGALVVPQRALQDLQGLAQLAVVGPDDKVEMRTVTARARAGARCG